MFAMITEPTFVLFLSILKVKHGKSRWVSVPIQFETDGLGAW